MTPNKIIITSVALYIIILVIMSISYSNQQFSGNDAAGNGMSSGLAFFYGLAILFFIAIIITVINAFFFKGITSNWVKFLFFVPIALPLIIFMITFFEEGKSKSVSIEKQDHDIAFEIRTKEKLQNIIFSFRNSNGGSHSKLSITKVEADYYVYESRKVIIYEDMRKLHVKSDQYITPEYHLEIPYKPEIIPFTDWVTLEGINKNTQDTIKFEFRYKITKSDY